MEDEHPFNMRVDIPSGPEADLDLSVSIALATSSLVHDIEDRPASEAEGLLIVSLGVEKHELKNEFRRLALAGVLSAVVGPWERRWGTRCLLEDRALYVFQNFLGELR